MRKLVIKFGIPDGEVNYTVGYTGGKPGRKIWTRNKIWKLLIANY